ncbi:MAG TPA: hypothetical protein VLA56_01330 [Pseudomonadales bacterium]|nr:hypothetical protein [Pseudomonadales bacterium]
MRFDRQIRRTLKGFAAALLLVSAAPVLADDFATTWGPALGTVAPAIAAPDQAGAERSLDDLARANGLLVVFARSADW